MLEAGRMSTKKKPHTSVSKTKMVRCRVEDCTEPMMEYQNYERHLKRNHPKENHKDKRTFGEKTFSFNLVKEKAGPEEAGPEKAGEEDEEDRVKSVEEEAKSEVKFKADDNNLIRRMKRKRSEEEHLMNI